MKLVYFARVKLARDLIVDGLSAIPGLDLVVATGAAGVVEALPGADALLCTHMSVAEAAPVVERLKAPDNTVRWIHFNSAGQDGWSGVGIPASITASYAAGAVAPTVAEHAMALTLALTRQIPKAAHLTDRHVWDRNELSPHMRSLEGATMAVLGFGHIGKEIAQRAAAFGMKVVTVSRRQESHPAVDTAYAFKNLETVLAEADVVMVALASTPHTRSLLGARQFACCKPSAYLVNIARGNILDEAALIDALDTGKIAGAALDAIVEEPMSEANPLWKARNLLISPHVSAGGSRESQKRIAAAAIENAKRAMRGEEVRNQITL